MEKAIQEWLDKKLDDYNENSQETLGELLNSTTCAIEQYFKSESFVAKEILKSCLECNKLFLEKIDL